MASTSETGHAKNVANFEDLISFCTAYGATYNPSKPALQLANLQTLRTAALAKLQAVKNTRTTFGNATNARQQGTQPIKALSTRIINALAASAAKPEVLADARTINRKIQGKRAKAVKAAPAPASATGETPAPTPKTISVSQQSFDSVKDNFTKLVQLLTQETNYAPNEADLKVAALNTLLTTLTTSNSAVVNSYTPYSNAIIDRDNTLYNPLTGLVEIAGNIKAYVKSIYNASSPQYKQVSGLQFKMRKG